MNMRISLVVAGLSALALLAGCKKEQPAPPPPPAAPAQPAPAPAPTPEPVAVSEIQTARVTGDDAGTAEPTTTFAPADSITALVFTTGTGNFALTARWTYGTDKIAVHDETHKVETSGAGVHQFRISKADGFPAGDYQVDVLIDGKAAGSRSFKVE